MTNIQNNIPHPDRSETIDGLREVQDIAGYKGDSTFIENDIEYLDFLLEIGTEELPPNAILKMQKALAEEMINALDLSRLSLMPLPEAQSFSTPRRLAIIFKNIAAKQNIKIPASKRGPNIKAAFDDDGNPTAAAYGFIKSCNISIEPNSLNIIKTSGKFVGDEKIVEKTVKKIRVNYVGDKNGTLRITVPNEKGEEWLVFDKKEEGGKTSQELLSKIVVQSLSKLPIPKIMRWSEGNLAFARPVHWVLMLHGSNVIKAPILGVMSDNKTYGHRFHCQQEITIDDPNQYEDKLLKGKVIADFEKRRESIKKQIEQRTENIGIPLINDELLDEVTNLIEFPVALLGSFDRRFLELPQEILLLCMQKQQKYFPILDKNRKLQSYFVIISNIESKDPASIIKGNQNVIHARLRDAEFFYQNDLKFSLDSYCEKLKSAIFQPKLGSIYERTARLTDLAADIAIKVGANAADTMKAAKLSKADLMTSMVGEFPELQGVMGYYYAIAQSVSETVAKPIREIYLPRFSKDKLPETLEGCALALADRIDFVVGLFSIGKVPTGEKDPFGLRRAVFGILRIILDKELNLNMDELVNESIKIYLKQLEKYEEIVAKNYQTPSQEQEQTIDDLFALLKNKIMKFVLDRFSSFYFDEFKMKKSFNFFAIKSLEPPITNFLDFITRLKALESFFSLLLSEVDHNELVGAASRIKNILKKETVAELENKRFNEKLLKEISEKELYSKLEEVSKIIDALLENRTVNNYIEAFHQLSKLTPFINNFFVNVMVMVEDDKLRNNRLLLVMKTNDLLNKKIANLSHLPYAYIEK